LLFVDDILIFRHCAEANGKSLKDILELFYEASSMVINPEKSAIYLPDARVQTRQTYLI